MPRTYIKNPSSRKYGYSPESLQNALSDIQNKKCTLRAASRKYKISFGTLHNKLHGKHVRKTGGQTVFTSVEEIALINGIIKCGDWGFPMDALTMRMFVKSYLDEHGRQESKFKNNIPGDDWMRSLLKRHKNVIGQRMASNISVNRSKVSHETIQNYFDCLGEYITEVPPENIFNYDETAVCDDPGKKKCLFKRGVKYPERISNHSKSSTTVMMCGSASGVLLPPYIIYKAEHIWNTWTKDGPKGIPCCSGGCCSRGTHFNRSISGWIDMTLFSDWFETTFLPHAKRLSGKKVLIGDNLSSHFSPQVLKQCTDNDIVFTCMPPNSSNICQPLDVGFFRAFKESWRQTLSAYKFTGSVKSSLPKEVFPKLLKQTLTTMNSKHENAHNTPCAVEKNLISSFEACGIYPLNADRVLKRLPNDRSEEEVNREVNDSLVEFLKKKRFAETTTRVQRKKKRINVKPGKSVTFENSEESEEESHVDDPPEQTAFNSINEDDHSLYDNEEELLENIMCEIPTSDKLKIGAFILAKFLGGSRKKKQKPSFQIINKICYFMNFYPLY